MGSARPRITSKDLSPVVQIVTWVLLAFILLAIILRLLTRYYLLHRIKSDDLFIVIAFVFSLGQSITLLVPAGSAWGVLQGDLSRQSQIARLKTQYASQLLLLPGICCAKTSVLLGLLAVTPVQAHRRAIFVLGATIVLYGLTSEFAIAFVCGVQNPWEVISSSSSCHGWQTLQRYNIVMNILTDIGLIAIPVAIITPLRMPIQKRLRTMTLYAARILVVAVTAVQLSYLERSFYSDYTLASFPYIICTQTVQALSVITACIPHLLPMLEGLKTGLLWTDDIQQQGHLDSYDAYRLSHSRRGYTDLELQPAPPGNSMEVKTVRDKIETNTMQH